MKRLLKLLTASALFLGLYSIPAQAGWEFTEWGISPEETIAMSDGKILPQRIDKENPKLFTYYKMDKIIFQSRFTFDEKRQLSRITLEMGDVSLCNSFHENLLSTYGKEVKNDFIKFYDPLPLGGKKLRYMDSTLAWADKAHNNYIELTIKQYTDAPNPESCVVYYSPLSLQN